jgi:hypothetical protein
MWNNLLRQNIYGSTSANIMSQLILAESESQIRADMKLMNSVDVGAELEIPLVKVPVTVLAGGSIAVTESAQIANSAESKRNTVVLKFEQVFYSAYITPKEGEMEIFKDVKDNELPDDLVYISSVDYGQVFYVKFTSDYSKETLMKAINMKFSSGVNLGVTVEGVPVSGNLHEGTSNLSESEMQSLLSSSNIEIKVGRVGGMTDNAFESATSFEEVLAGIRRISTRFTPTNLGAPIAYTLNFCKGHSLAYINYNLGYGTQNCGYTFKGKYDVQLELDHMDVDNCQDWDKTEDLYGNVKFTYLKTGNKEVNGDKIFWSKSKDDANSNNFRNGIRRIDEKKILIENLTLNELKNISLYLAGNIKDDEGFLKAKDFECANCQILDGSYGKRKVFFIDESATQESIKKLVLNGNWQALKFGDDSFLNLTFYEEGKKQDGIVTFKWKVNVRPK